MSWGEIKISVSPYMGSRIDTISVGGTIVVGNIQRVAASIIRCIAYVPNIRVGSVYKCPSIVLNGILKIANIG